MIKRRTLKLVDPKKVPFYIGILFFLSGLLFLAIGIIGSKSQHREAVDIVQLQTPIEVIDVRSRKMRRKNKDAISPKHKLVYSPVFQATLASGEIVKFNSTSWSRPAAYKVGDRVAGYYDPKTGAIYSDKTLKKRGLIAPIFIGLGAILASLGALMLVVGIRRQSRKI